MTSPISDVAWCFPPSPLLHSTSNSVHTIFTSISHPQLLQTTPRRPRPNFLCTANIPPSPPSSSSQEIPQESPDTQPPPLSSSPTQLGLLTDSVLETKWKKEDQSSPSQPSLPPPQTETPPRITCLCDPLADDEIIASDPYEAFARFTRIAAPTAALGRDNVPIPPQFPPLPPLLRRRDLPYSAASIAHRLMKYTYANKNLSDFIQLFLGEFDNYDQIAAERRMGMYPRDGGGHEHIHCSIVQLTSDMLFARYYFNGNPGNVFRSRVYQVKASDESERGIVEMRIFRFYEETERRLKAANYDVDAVEWDADDVYDWLKGCEVYWERYMPGDEVVDDVSVQLGIEPGPRFVGYMKGGGCELYSRDLAGRIRVMDDLLLTGGELWVADRGFDEKNCFVYGNRRGVPYKMKRVEKGGELDWTLSESAQAPEGYIS